MIERTLVDLVDVVGCDLVLTTGGTGPAPRDVTPEATLAVAHKVLPGFGEQMRQVSLQVRSDRDPVAPGRRRSRPGADHQPARPAEGDQGNARRRLPRGPLLPRPDRRPVHRNERRRLQGVSSEVGRASPAVTATPFPNQPPPYEGCNLYRTDVALQEAVRREGAQDADGDLERWGETLGSAETFALADAANRHPPQASHPRSRRRRASTGSSSIRPGMR